MIDKEDNFNEFLKQKVEESHFEFNEAYWLKAEKLIESAQPKRKPFWLGFGWGVLSLAIITGLGAFVWNLAQDNDKLVSKENINHAQTALNTNVLQANLESSQSQIVPNEAANITTQATVAQKEMTVKSAKGSVTYKVTNPTKKLSTSQKSSVLHGLIESQNINNSKQITANLNKGSEGNFSQVRNLSVPKLPQSTFNDNEETEEESYSENSRTITIAEPVVIRTKSASAKDIDVNIVAACENQYKHEWMLSLLGGVSDSRGFEGNTASNSRIGFGYFGGLRVAYKLDKNFFVALQPLMYSRGAINTSVQTEKTAYDFGAKADEFVVKNKSILFAELPISIGYRVNRHQISIGAGIEYLVNVKSDVKEFGATDYTSNQWGYTNGFNRFGSIAVFNYAFKVYNEFWLTMMVQKGFTDMTKSDYFTTNSSDKNLNLRIGVQYLFNNQKKKAK
jgi:hypothetical protein